MTSLQLYKFILDNEIEWHWRNNNNVEDVIAFVSIYQIKEFNELLLPSSIFEEEGLNCIMKDGYFCFWMTDICEHFGIDVEEVFPKKDQQN